MRTAKRITTACLTAIMIFQALAPSTEVFAQELDAVMEASVSAARAAGNTARSVQDAVATALQGADQATSDDVATTPAPTLALPRAATVLPTLANHRTPRPMEPLTAIPQRRATRPKTMRLPMRVLLTENKRMTRTRMLLIRQTPPPPSLLSRISGTRWVTAMSSLTTWAPSRPLPLSPRRPYRHLQHRSRHLPEREHLQGGSTGIDFDVCGAEIVDGLGSLTFQASAAMPTLQRRAQPRRQDPDRQQDALQQHRA